MQEDHTVSRSDAASVSVTGAKAIPSGDSPIPGDNVEIDRRIRKEHRRVNVTEQLFLDVAFVDQAVPDPFEAPRWQMEDRRGGHVRVAVFVGVGGGGELGQARRGRGLVDVDDEGDFVERDGSGGQGCVRKSPEKRKRRSVA